MKYRIAILGFIPLILAACSSGESATQTVTQDKTPAASISEQPPMKRWFQFQHVSQGAKVYQQNCAACHGKQGEGAVNWRQTGPDGKYPAPPLNGTGHAWHHPLKMLAHVIRNGSPGGQGNMPAWKEKLTNDEILSVIAWFQAKWPIEVYEAWARRDAAQRGKAG